MENELEKFTIGQQLKINTEDDIGKLIVGDSVIFKKHEGYPCSPGTWFWKEGTYIGKWSVDEICVKFNNQPKIVNIRNLKNA